MPRPISVALAAILAVAAAAVTPAATDHAWVIVVDDLHVPFVQTGRLRDLLRKISTELIQEGDRYVFRASGPSAVSLTASALNDDRTLAASAIKFMSGNGLKESDVLVTQWSTSPVNEVLYRANIALDAAEEAVYVLTGDAAPRQAIVYVSSGYDVETYPALADRVKALARRARENNITIFAIDARGLETRDLDTLPIPNSTEAWSRYLAATRRSLAILTGETGGFVIERPNDPSVGLKRIAEQMRSSP